MQENLVVPELINSLQTQNDEEELSLALVSLYRISLRSGIIFLSFSLLNC